MNLVDQDWMYVKKYLSKNNAIIVPLGSTEQHGPSLPLSTDAFLADKISERLGEKFNFLVGPLLSVGVGNKRICIFTL